MEYKAFNKQFKMSSPCKFLFKCTNTKCTFAHASPTAPSDFVFADLSKRIQVCKFAEKCKRSDCVYGHPSPSTYKVKENPSLSTYKVKESTKTTPAPKVDQPPIPSVSSFKMNTEAPEFVPSEVKRVDTPVVSEIPPEMMSNAFVSLYEMYQSMVNSGLSNKDAIVTLVEQMKSMGPSIDEDTLTQFVTNAVETGEAIQDDLQQQELYNLLELEDEDGSSEFGELDDEIQREFENFINEGCEAMEQAQQFSM